MNGVTYLSEELPLLKSLIKLRIAEYELREEKKFDRKIAQAKTGLSYSHLSGVINGKQQTTPENLFILAQLLGCKVDDLYEYKED